MNRLFPFLLMLGALRAEAQIQGYAIAAHSGEGSSSVPADGIVVWHRPGTTASTNAYYGAEYPATLGGAMAITADGFTATNKSSSATLPTLPGTWEDAFAFFGWVKITNFAATHYIFSNTGGNAGDGFRLYATTAGALVGQYVDASTVFRGRQTAAGAVTSNAWVHIGLVKQAGAVTNMALYSIWVNGVQADNGNATGGTMSGSGEAFTNRIYIANLQGSSTGGLLGSIDEVLFYAVAVPTTEGEIAAIMDATRGGK